MSERVLQCKPFLKPDSGLAASRVTLSRHREAFSVVTARVLVLTADNWRQLTTTDNLESD